MHKDPALVQQHIEEFRRRRNRQLAISVPFIALMFAWIWLGDHPESMPAVLQGGAFLMVFLAALAGIFIFSFRNWRCPACNGYLGKGWGPSFCPKCGAQLR